MILFQNNIDVLISLNGCALFRFGYTKYACKSYTSTLNTHYIIRKVVVNCNTISSICGNKRVYEFTTHLTHWMKDPMESVLDSNSSNYEIKSELSNCCFGIGIVYLAKHVPSQQFVAIKKFQMDKAKEESNLIRVSVCFRMRRCPHKTTLWNFIHFDFYVRKI